MANNDGLGEGAYDRSKLMRSFPCRFCPRVFRNAQALGGHMNVHRRERALAKDLVQLQFDHKDPHGAEGSCEARGCNHHHRVAHEASTSVLHDHFIMTSYPVSSSSASSSSPPDHHVPTSDFFATSSRLAYNKIQLLGRRDSKGRDCHPAAVDLELRLGHRTPEL